MDVMSFHVGHLNVKQRLVDFHILITRIFIRHSRTILYNTVDEIGGNDSRSYPLKLQWWQYIGQLA